MEGKNRGCGRSGVMGGWDYANHMQSIMQSNPIREEGREALIFRGALRPLGLGSLTWARRGRGVPGSRAGVLSGLAAATVSCSGNPNPPRLPLSTHGPWDMDQPMSPAALSPAVQWCPPGGISKHSRGAFWGSWACAWDSQAYPAPELGPCGY